MTGNLGYGGRESCVPKIERIVAVGLLTPDNLTALGSNFTRAYPVDETPCFGELLRAIDEADREIRIDRSEQ